MKPMKLFSLILVAVNQLTVTLPFAAELPEHTLRAAYLYNFGLLTDWPMAPSGAYEYCFYHTTRYDDAIDILSQKTLNELPVRIRFISRPDEAMTCHVLVIGQIERFESKQLMAQVSNLPILTIAEAAPYYLKPLVAINLLPTNEHIGFEVNLAVSKQANLILSARLLKVAKSVYQ